MAEIFGADGLVNPTMVKSTPIDMSVPDLGDLIKALPEDIPQAPRLVPSPAEVGPAKSWDGMENLNAEAFMSASSAPAPAKMNDEAIMKQKYDMRRKFERLTKMGVPVRKRFTMDSPIEEMELELETLRKDRDMDNAIRQFSSWFVTGMSAMEWSSKNVNAVRMFGLQLDGLSESAQMGVGEFEEDFEELYELYGDKMKVHPLVRIPMRVAIMVYMVHLTNQMAQKAPVPNIQEILRQNPEIGRKLAGAAMQQQTQQFSAQAAARSAPPPPPQPAASNPLSGLMSFMTAGVNTQGPPLPAPIPVPSRVPEKAPARTVISKTPAPRREMNGPSGTGIADMLQRIQAEKPAAPPVPTFMSQNIPPAAPPPKPRSKAGSTGRNSVKIML